MRYLFQPCLDINLNHYLLQNTWIDFMLQQRRIKPLILILTEKRCIECKAKLSEFEVKEKEGLCLECFKERSESKRNPS
jgi:hypothetical protein